jgi:hypothetical protein
MELNEREGVTRLFDQLKLEATPDTWSVMGQVYNHKREDKPSNFSEEFCRDRLMRYIEKCREEGITLPDLPQLQPL